MKNRWNKIALLGLFAMLMSVCGLQAQNINSTIRGEVLDPSGALVAHATVVIVNQQTNTTVFSGKTDDGGNFVAPQIFPGVYRLTATAPGLKQTVVKGIVATVAQTASVNVNMELGANTEVVTVQSRGEELDRTTSDISTVISPEEVDNVPLKLRAPESLLSFVPGVTYGGGNSSINTSQLSINGSRTANTEVLLNGVSLILGSTGALLPLPSPDGIDQLRFLTSNAPAEYGRTSGAVLAANVLSGTGSYHGQAYFLMRNEALDANTYFNKLSNSANGLNPGAANYKARARDRYFLMGGSFGGPVRIPHLYDGRGKTFFFANYDRLINKNSSTVTSTVPGYIPAGGGAPHLGQRTGDFSESTNKVYQPGGTATPQYTGNMVTGIDPAAAKIIALLPAPNSVGVFDAANARATNNYSQVTPLETDNLRFVARVDEQATAKDRISVFLYKYTSSVPNAVTFNPLLNTAYDCLCTRAYVTSIDYTRVWSPSIVSDISLGFFRYGQYRNPPGVGLNASSQLGIASLPLDETPTIVTTAISALGAQSNANQSNITNTFPLYGSVTKTFGGHTIKMGAAYRDNEFNNFNPAAYPQGQLNFDGSITNHGNTGNPTTQLADFLAGKIKTASYELPQPPTGRRNYNVSLFAQDDYRITSKLTLNAGLRYEFEAPLTISNNIYSRVDTTNGGLLAAGLHGTSRSLNITTAKLNFSPRIGVAYSLNSKTVFRSAFGMFYGTIFQNLGGQLAYPGYDINVSFNNQGTAVAQPFSLANGLPLTGVQNLQDPFTVYNAGTPSSPYAFTGTQFGDLSRLPLVQQWNAGFQRQLPFALTLEANYVGNHSVHLPGLSAANAISLAQSDAVTTANTTTATQNARPFHNVTQVTQASDNGDSRYNSLQITVRRQFNKSLAILSNYTLAKSTDDGSTIFNFSAPNGLANSQFYGDPKFRKLDNAVSSFDVTHTLNIAVVYTTGGPWYTRGWKISPVFVGHTGLPLNITQTNEIPSAGQQRPNGSTNNLKVKPYAVGTAIQYFRPPTDPQFTLTPSGPINSTIGGVRTLIIPTNQAVGGGTTPRDSVRCPGEVDFDASLSKEFPIYGRLKFQFRVDAFNVINHTNFTAPAGALAVVTSGTTANFTGNNTFGKVTGTQPARNLQLVARFNF